MIINMRYYLITIASIFLALGIGIFIGFTLDGQEIFVEQQQSLISELEYRFSEIKGENANLKKLIDQKEEELLLHREFINQVFPRLVEDKLQGLNVVIVESSDEFIYTGLITSLKKAGANVLSVTFIKRDFVEGNPEKMQQVLNRLKENVEMDKLQEYMSKRLANAILTQKDNEFVASMKELELIEVSGEYNGPVDYFVIAGGSTMGNTGNVTKVDIPMITAVKSSNIPVVGVEKTDCAESYIPYYKKMKISTVDNIDSIIGQYSLIMILQGNEGHFGVKDTADALTPDDYKIR
jgi:DNA-binding Lrp family transcriptional regulator